MFTVTILKEGKACCIIPQGKLDTLSFPVFDRELQPLLEQEKFLIIDFSQCHYLSSSGIRLLISAAKKLKSKGGDLLLASLPPEVFQVIEMTGLRSVFQLFLDKGAAEEEVMRMAGMAEGTGIMTIEGLGFRVSDFGKKEGRGYKWADEGIAGYDELGFSVGTGSPAGSLVEDVESRGLFVTMRRCAGFIPMDPEQSPDFRVVRDPSEGGIFVQEAHSFGMEPTSRLELIEAKELKISQLTGLLPAITGKTGNAVSLVVADFHPERPSISGLTTENRGIVFILNQLTETQPGETFMDYLARSLTLETIESVEEVNPDAIVAHPVVWLFAPEIIEDAETSRIRVESAGDSLEPWKIFVTRRLYSDSRRLVVKPLHGGYSAQTFQVESFDAEGRKLRPTVLKIGSRAMISRESERCRQYALPYIMNNSAQVLGTVFYSDMGALRYNFVGIGGEQTQLRWLAHYYREWPAEKLEPLFDKIFMQILQPWYGQPVTTTLYPYRDHDPRAVFFKTLCETAEQVLGISSDEPVFTIAETGETRTNPYWFLKHRFAERRDWPVSYPATVCHGDLNMQNILLDREMNVYLIDFSETKPRSAISDFARLEAIFMIEHAVLDSEENRRKMVELTTLFYNRDRLDDLPVVEWTGSSPETMQRNLAMTLKMRQYALQTTSGNPDIRPYYLALLEWILPIVCYTGAPVEIMWLSACVAGIICEKL
jgi:anti-anti-sigma factor